ncbi:MAG: diacylglycerol kinase family lipid kinase [Prevotellaceae bacterium]|jgi:diacylglycerol kinase (ATP)|nr:diacylglycerol kinase family lipid kinase [Prevotellaceae bacterium]
MEQLPANQKWALIMNPKSGKKTFRKQKKYLLNHLTKANIVYEYRVTERSGHAVSLVSEFIEKGYKHFLILGGDGTVSEVTNGIFRSGTADFSDMTIALIPSGTGNDWGRFWQLTRNYKKSLQVFFAGKCRNIDIGQVTYTKDNTRQSHFFINSVGFGLDAEVVHLTHRLKRYLGSFSFLYTISLLLAVFSHKPTEINIQTEQVCITKDVFTMNIGNGCYSGGGIKQTPEATPYDGILDVLVAKQPTFKDVVTILPRLFNGTILQHRIIYSFKGKEFNLRFDKNENILVEADGINLEGQAPFNVKVIPSALRMIVPNV